MSLNKKIFGKVALLSLFVSVCAVLGGCSNRKQAEDLGKTAEPSKNEVEPARQESTEIEKDFEEAVLSIDSPRCIGCGRCAKIAPENFSMQGRKAVVSSQEIGSEGTVENAIKNCPVNVISMAEAD